MVYVKQMELKKRDEVYQDPMLMQKIKELNDRIENKKREKKKKKKKEKEMKEEKAEPKEDKDAKVEVSGSRALPEENDVETRKDAPVDKIDDVQKKSVEKKRDRSNERRREPRDYRDECRSDRYDRHDRDREDRERRHQRERHEYRRDRESRHRDRRDRDVDRRYDRERRDQDKDRRHERDRYDRDYYHRSDRHRLRSRSRSRSLEEKRQRSISPPDSLLGPDMKLFAARKRELEQADALKKAKSKDSEKAALRKLTQEEKMALVDQMQQSAQNLDQNKKDKLQINDIDTSKLTSHEITREQNKNKSAKFLNKVKKESYMEAGLTLDERLSRNKHYRGRIENKDE